METELLYTSAIEQARAIRSRQISSEELVLSTLRRLESLHATLNTVIQIAPDSALEQARAADEALAHGRNLGPLHGVPFTVKDVYAVRDSAHLVTIPNGKAPIALPDTVDSTAVLRLCAAGAILTARTRATLWSDRDTHYGPAHNPYDLTRTTSGSSGGEAATIAAGGSPLGLGSDSGGSLRLPAHCCGVATLRPSNGRVPRATDADGTNDPRTVAGPIARSIEDVALALEILNGFDWTEPTTLPIPLADYRATSLNGLRVAVHTTNGLVAPTPETAATVLAAAQVLNDAGAVVEPIPPPGLEESWEITQEYWHYCGETGSVSNYFRFLERWDRYRIAMLGFMRSYDLILCPVEAFPAPIETATDTPQMFTYTAPYSLVGWPCAVVRAGASPEGLPIGVQIVAAPWRDDVALAAARPIEIALGGWRSPG